MKKILSGVICFGGALSLLLSGCGEKDVKPLDTAAFKKITFSFQDQDPDKNKLQGDLILDGAADLTSVKEYIVYWGNRPTDGGKTLPFKSVTSLSGNVLTSLEKGTVQREDYFLLYLKDAEGKEHFSQKVIKIKDLATAQKAKDQQTDKEEKKEEKSPVAAPAVQQAEATPEQTPSQLESTPDDNLSQNNISAPESDLDTPVTVTPSAVTAPQPASSNSSATESKAAQPMVIFIKNILFKFDRSSLTQEYMDHLMNKLGDLDNKENVKLRIEGHADERGSNEYNLALGERRAYAVKKFLITMGFAPKNIQVVSYGEEKPAVQGHNEEAWSQNRRAVTEVKEK